MLEPEPPQGLGTGVEVTPVWATLDEVQDNEQPDTTGHCNSFSYYAVSDSMLILPSEMQSFPQQ